MLEVMMDQRSVRMNFGINRNSSFSFRTVKDANPKFLCWPILPVCSSNFFIIDLFCPSVQPRKFMPKCWMEHHAVQLLKKCVL